MRGLDRLLAIRRSGMRPADMVTLATDIECLDCEGWVICDEADEPGSTDLRPFLGLSVMVTGREFKTVDAWARAVANAGAASVAIVVAGDYPSADDMAILKHNGEMLA